MHFQSSPLSNFLFYLTSDHFVLVKKRNSLLFSDKIHCVCPDGHNYLDTEYKFKEEGDISEMLVNYFCLPVSLDLLTLFCFA